MLGSQEWKMDPYLRQVEPLEILVLFEERMKELETEHDVTTRKKKVERLRDARKAREGFKVGPLIQFEHAGWFHLLIDWLGDVL